MPFGASGQKFPMGGLGFEGQQGMGSSPGGLLGNDMVMYPTYDKTSSLYSLFMAFFLLLHLSYLNTRPVGGSGLERGFFVHLSPDVLLVVVVPDILPVWCSVVGRPAPSISFTWQNHGINHQLALKLKLLTYIYWQILWLCLFILHGICLRLLLQALSWAGQALFLEQNGTEQQPFVMP